MSKHAEKIGCYCFDRSEPGVEKTPNFRIFLNRSGKITDLGMIKIRAESKQLFQTPEFYTFLLKSYFYFVFLETLFCSFV